MNPLVPALLLALSQACVTGPDSTQEVTDVRWMVAIGMTKDEVRALLGEPMRFTRTTEGPVEIEVWGYDFDNPEAFIVHFWDGKVHTHAHVPWS